MAGERRDSSLSLLLPQAGPVREEEALPALLCGVDEAGRGCLAGPVVAAAVIFPPGFDFALLPNLTDSKKLSEKQRLVLEPLIRRHAAGFALGLASAQEIDSINILNATFRAMSRAVHGLLHRYAGDTSPLELRIDGDKIIPPAQWLPALRRPRFSLPAQAAIVGGDALVPAISAASILAKNLRDRLLIAADAHHPNYGFARHKGYGTPPHLAALKRFGPCPLHRRTFAGVTPQDAPITQGTLLG